MFSLAPVFLVTFQLSARPWGGVCAVPQFINSFDKDDARLEANYIQGQQYTYSGEYMKRSIDGKPFCELLAQVISAVAKRWRC